MQRPRESARVVDATTSEGVASAAAACILKRLLITLPTSRNLSACLSDFHGASSAKAREVVIQAEGREHGLDASVGRAKRKMRAMRKSRELGTLKAEGRSEQSGGAVRQRQG